MVKIFLTSKWLTLLYLRKINSLAKFFFLQILILTVGVNLCFSQEDKLLNTKRVFWKTINIFSLLDLNNNQVSKTDYSQLAENITLTKNNSVLIKVDDTKITRITAQDNKIDQLDIWRISSFGKQAIKLKPKEIILQKESLLIQVPYYLTDSHYEIKLKDNSTFDNLKIKIEENVIETYPFYFDEVENIAKKAIETGTWQELTAKVWQKLEPGDPLIPFYREQFMLLPWIRSKGESETEYEKIYRQAKLQLALIQERDKTHLSSQQEPIIFSSTHQVLLIDNLIYKYGNTFTLDITGPTTIEIKSRLPYLSTPLNEVEKYFITTTLDGYFYEQNFFDTRIDDICELKVDYQQNPLGRLRQKPVFIPIGTHKITFTTSSPLYFSLAKTTKVREKLLNSLKPKDDAQEIEEKLLQVVKLTESISLLSNKHAHFLHASALFDLGRGQEALKEVKTLISNAPDDLVSYAASILMIHILWQTNNFEEASCYAPLFLFNKDKLNTETSNTSLDLMHLLASALRFRLGLEHAKTCRFLAQHSYAAKLLPEIIKFDITDLQSYELLAESLKWTNDFFGTNPELITAYDLFLSINPIDNRFRRLRTRAWGDFTYWKELVSEKNSGKNKLKSIDYLAPDLPLNVPEEDNLLINKLSCSKDPESAYFRPIDYLKDSKIFSIPINTTFEIDLRNPFDLATKNEIVKLKTESLCGNSNPLELTVYANKEILIKQIIYTNSQNITLTLKNQIYQLFFEIKPIDNNLDCIKLFLDRPPLSDIYQRTTTLPNWLVYNERDYLPLGINETGKVDFITEDDKNPTIGRLLINSLKNTKHNVDKQQIINIFINAKNTETIIIDPKLTNLFNQNDNNIYPYEILFPIASGKHRISIQRKDTEEGDLFINFSLRLRRNEKLKNDN